MLAAFNVFFSSLIAVAGVLAEVVEGESEIINIREADGRLGPLVFGLLALGVLAIIGTVVFWWLTRPGQLEERDGRV